MKAYLELGLDADDFKALLTHAETDPAVDAILRKEGSFIRLEAKGLGILFYQETD